MPKEKDGEPALLREFRDRFPAYQAFTEQGEKLISDLLQVERLEVHAITSRVKDPASLREKIKRSEGKYRNLSEITDLSGIRIITYFEEDVGAVAEIIEAEFVVDPENTVDKGAVLDPDRFGYVSLHYVVELSPSRLKLTEYKEFSGLKLEVQIRSALQHAWAEIEHRLGYKGMQAVPRQIRRRFSRIAGLLEVADEEFCGIREELHAYEENVAERIDASPETVTVDKASLLSFVRGSVLVQELDAQIASFAGAEIVERERLLGDMVDRVAYFGLDTIAHLESQLGESGNEAIQLAERWIGQHDELNMGISLHYLFYVLAASDRSEERLLEYLERFSIGDPSERPDLPARIIAKITEAENESS